MINLLLLAAVLAGQPGPPEPGPELWYDKPAATWTEALPVGNGHLGAMVHGRPHAERIQLNEDTVWAGSPQDRVRHGAHQHLERARALLFAGDYAAGQALMQREFMSERLTRSYQTLGDLLITDLQPAGEVSEYRRGLDLDPGIAWSEWSADGVRRRTEVLASAIDDVIVVRRVTDTSGALSLRVELDRPADATVVTVGENELLMTGRVTQDGAAPGVRFAARLRVVVDGGTVRVEAGALRVEGADAVTIFISGATDFGGGDPTQLTAATIEAVAPRLYAYVRSDHEADHRSFMKRVRFELGEENPLPTDARLAAMNAGGDDPALCALYLQYARYLLLASSRPGSQPANLQGLWNEHLAAPWNADYHLNINLQMNYWPAEVLNLPECHEPLFDLVERLQERGVQTARELYDAEGWVAHHVTDIWAFTMPVGQTVWGLWPTGGAWSSRHLFEHYEFGGDETFLRERAWPVLRGAARFFLEYLAVDPATGALVSGPSTSPENTFIASDGTHANTSMGATMDQMIIWDLFTNVLEAAEQLALQDDPLVAEVRAAREKLAGPTIGPDGRLQEWARPLGEAEPGHRHMSHLFGLHPGRQISPEQTPGLAAAARRVLEHRLANGGGHTGWSRAWIINFYARLGDGAAAHEHLLALLRRSTLPNLFDDHPPFQIDGNFGGAAGIAEMLVQSHGGTVSLLPALPPAWRNGSITGLRARGGLVVDLEWHDGQLTRASILATRDGTVTVRTANGQFERTLKAGESWTLERDAGASRRAGEGRAGEQESK